MDLEKLFSEMELYAENQHVPIIRSGELKCFTDAVKAQKPRRILEIGTAIGYSAMKILQNSPDGAELVSLELDESRADTAQKYIDKSPFRDKIHIIRGDAGEVLKDIKNNPVYKAAFGQQGIDLVFIDAAKGHYMDYLDGVLPLLSDSASILSDNVLFRGIVLSDEKPPHRYRTIVVRLREYIRRLQELKGFQTKIYEDGDGLAVSIRREKGDNDGCNE